MLFAVDLVVAQGGVSAGLDLHARGPGPVARPAGASAAEAGAPVHPNRLGALARVVGQVRCGEPVDLAPVSDIQDQDDEPVVVNLVENSPVTGPDAPDAIAAKVSRPCPRTRRVLSGLPVLWPVGPVIVHRDRLLKRVARLRVNLPAGQFPEGLHPTVREPGQWILLAAHQAEPQPVRQ
jgi:hypothetical protein